MLKAIVVLPEPELAHQSEHLARLKLKRHILDDRARGAEADGEVGNGQQACHGLTLSAARPAQ